MSNALASHSGNYAPELDGIRALAVWMVLLTHAGAPGFGGGWVGVDVFFVLSGFLITTLLMAEDERSGRIVISSFLIRRALRLFPAYFAYVLPLTVFFLLTPVSTKHDLGVWSPTDLVVSLWTYTVNVLPMGGIWDYQYLTRHLWSLAVEQQFYIVLPVLFLVSRQIGVGLGMLLLLTLAGSWAIAYTHLVPVPEKASLLARGNALLVGCLVAYLGRGVDSKRSERDTLSKMLTVLHITGVIFSVIGVVVLLWSVEFNGTHVFGKLSWASLALYISFGVGVAGYWYGWSTFGSRLFRTPILVQIGKVSYGVYIYHMVSWALVFLLADDFLDWTSSRYINYGTKLFIYIALAHAVAVLSYRLIERPFLKRKRLFSGSHTRSRKGATA